jgi:hypothetical protein
MGNTVIFTRKDSGEVLAIMSIFNHDALYKFYEMYPRDTWNYRWV